MRLTPEQLAEARRWIADCQWADLEPDDVEELTPEEVERGIARHYVGGVTGSFRTAGPPPLS